MPPLDWCSAEKMSMNGNPYKTIRGSSVVERLPEEQRGAGSSPALRTIVGWSNGRTPDSDSGGVGSTPTPIAKKGKVAERPKAPAC